MSTLRRAGAIIVSVGAGIALLGTFLTWIRSGSTSRSSYELFGLVDRLGFSPNGVVGSALRLWPLVPMLLVLSVVGTWWRADDANWRAGSAVVTFIAAAYAGTTALAVANAPDISFFTVGPGPIVTVIGALTMLIGLVLEPLVSRVAAR